MKAKDKHTFKRKCGTLSAEQKIETPENQDSSICTIAITSTYCMQHTDAHYSTMSASNFTGMNELQMPNFQGVCSSSKVLC